MPEPLRVDLAKSIALFQLGEAGAGRLAHEIDGAHFRGTDDDYIASVKYFVREEGRHALILAAILRGLDGAFLSQSWANSLFTWGRRLLGIRFKLVVALVAEVVGLAFYGALAEGLGAGPISDALLHICGDENAHLAFHADFFQTQLISPLRRLAFRALWWTVGLAAMGVVLRDHRRTLRGLGFSLAHTARRFMALLVHAENAALGRLTVAPSTPVAVQP